MAFNSLRFLLFFPVVVSLVWALPKKFRWIGMLAASWYFYLFAAPKAFFALLLTCFSTWLVGLLLPRCSRPGGKKALVAAAFVLNLGLLYTFKYFSFGLEILNRLLGLLHLRVVESSFSPVIPLGISFFILQALSYPMDVYRGQLESEKNFFRYALFVSFFPQLISGPIGRARALLPQYADLEKRDFDFTHFKHGLWRMLWGYFQKMVIADRITLFVDSIYAAPAVYREGGCLNWTALLLFALQTYADFCGYSDLAIGAAEILGIELPVNFRQPFFSVNISEFWVRWHISLSQWFTHYLYIPLGGNRRGKVRQLLNVMIIFIASGLWHGAGKTFLVWGFLNGAISVTERLLTPLYRKIHAGLGFDEHSTGFRALQSAYVLVMFGFVQVFFRAESMTQALEFLKGLFRLNPYQLFNGELFNYGLDRAGFLLLGLSLLVRLLVSLAQLKGSVREQIDRQPLLCRWALAFAGIFFVLLFGIYGPGFNAGNFIYAQF